MKLFTLAENSTMFEACLRQEHLRNLLQCKDARWCWPGLQLLDYNLLQFISKGLALEDEVDPLALFHLLDILLHLHWTKQLLHILWIIRVYNNNNMDIK